MHFAKVLKCDNQIQGFRLYNDGTTVSYIALDTSGNPATYPYNKTEKKVTNQMREEVPLLYLTLDRQSIQQIRPTQWTLYGKLLNHINSSIDKSDNDIFIEGLSDSYQNNIFPYVKPMEDLLNQFVKEQTGRQLNLNLSVIDPSMILKDLRPRIKDNNGFEIDIDKEGAGIQSAVSIAIARTYAELTQMPLIMAIEEPEIFLHPHACRHFYSILKSLSKSGIQIIYSTHRESFIDIIDYQNIKLIHKNGIATEVRSFAGEVENFDEIKIASKFNSEMNEVFFAEKVILVEGPADKISVKLALEKLGYDLDGQNISVIECGGISNIKLLIEILNRFNIYCITIVDQDPDNVVTLKNISEIKKLLKDSDKDLFIQEPNLEGMLKYNRGKFSKESASKEIPSLLEIEVPDMYLNLMSRINL